MDQKVFEVINVLILDYRLTESEGLSAFTALQRLGYSSQNVI
jgi:hypothetical protein